MVRPNPESKSNQCLFIKLITTDVTEQEAIREMQQQHHVQRMQDQEGTIQFWVSILTLKGQ